MGARTRQTSSHEEIDQPNSSKDLRPFAGKEQYSIMGNSATLNHPSNKSIETKRIDFHPLLAQAFFNKLHWHIYTHTCPVNHNASPVLLTEKKKKLPHYSDSTIGDNLEPPRKFKQTPKMRASGWQLQLHIYVYHEHILIVKSNRIGKNIKRRHMARENRLRTIPHATCC